MDYNEVKEGERYMIDVGYTNSGEVILTKIYGKNFCRVMDPETGYAWDTMLYRLSIINSMNDAPA